VTYCQEYKINIDHKIRLEESKEKKNKNGTKRLLAEFLFSVNKLKAP